MIFLMILLAQQQERVQQRLASSTLTPKLSRKAIVGLLLIYLFNVVTLIVVAIWVLIQDITNP